MSYQLEGISPSEYPTQRGSILFIIKIKINRVSFLMNSVTGIEGHSFLYLESFFEGYSSGEMDCPQFIVFVRSRCVSYRVQNKVVSVE